MDYKVISGGVTAPDGFFASGVACGLKKNGNKDIALIVSEDTAAVAGVFTTNVVKGHSLKRTLEHIRAGYGNAILINSGNANACVGEQGDLDALEMCTLTAELLECDPAQIFVGSTGVIGQPLNMEKVRDGIRNAVEAMHGDGGHEAMEAIMTTDLVPKEIAVEIELNGIPVRIGAMAKGSGMIHPNMATMIGIITTDCNISKNLLQKALKDICNKTFNRVSVDGDTSVCDMVMIMANGQADHEAITIDNKEYQLFRRALEFVCTFLSRKIAQDGEGATKLVDIQVSGAATSQDAYKAAVAIAKSPLVKTAIFGEDANWGRILTAAGYSGAQFNPDKAGVFIGELEVCKNGTALPFDEELAKKILSEKEIVIRVIFGDGEASDRMWTCDFSYDYVKINGSYRS